MMETRLEQPKIGDIIHVKYKDHVLLRNMIPGNYGPMVVELVGWLAEDKEDYIRIEFERYNVLSDGIVLNQKMSSVTILKNCVLDLKVLIRDVK